MPYIYNIIKADYLQRTRSYSFLITLAITVYAAYSFVPPDTANYTTLSASGYRGVYNSAWVGYVSAIMTTVMLSFYGFLLVNSGIKKDIDTEVGLIIATTPISNFKYLLCKQLSNYLVLITIAGCTFSVSLVLFFIRGEGHPFIISDFILPYLFFAVPALFMVAALAVVAEVFLGKRSILQYIIYFFLCGIVMSTITQSGKNTTGAFDPFGLSLVTKSITAQINTQFHESVKNVSFGFIFNGHRKYKPFVWAGISWSAVFVFSRALWMAFGLGLVYCSSLFFHRFDFKQASAKKKIKAAKQPTEANKLTINPAGITREAMPSLVFNYGIFPFIKTELLLLVRQGNKWLWLLNAGLWVAMFIAPLPIAYSYLLPILLFLQVTRWSDLVTKEKTNRVHYFAYASYNPLLRMLPAQILAGVVLALALALPVIMRNALLLNSASILNIINGCVLIVLLAATLGILSGGKKLFEVVFFMLTYAVINKLDITDYLGSMPHSSMYLAVVLSINIALVCTGFIVRNYQVKHL
ncbi:MULTISPECIES: hypothetical protein [unclassified Mucilaginibacter]|uniref:hypothetical protein n=1 Tax=unclassified Mucilaginibacter TaxID=2617802 RepID=UPI002AC9BBF1|nr:MULTISPECIES: hypothetical protein [unclassified Mucilaginibacter]MEB0263398.1 hypothetical protein [Mucilaginibacter sp. 10I4]MEB0278573.1 hypothetical protein [Mucilaginibacter sp. 10B2]MEB0299284.1 hypothetical protein [Mucilaginibacter sp. 5C4]WPX23471.1 hypothetical protein RHM67_19535 [Mucilaginibacter sp. 5C4]